ncbi:MAG: hypothetical protein ACP5FY_10920, partial [Kosmotogaceae bacterium]
MIEHGIPAARSKLLAPDIQSNTEDITSSRLICLNAGKLGISRSEIRRASHSSARRWKKFRNLCLEGKTIKKAWAELDGEGAIGAVILALEEIERKTVESSFKFGYLNLDFRPSSFICNGCSNSCE